MTRDNDDHREVKCSSTLIETAQLLQSTTKTTFFILYPAETDEWHHELELLSGVIPSACLSPSY